MNTSVSIAHLRSYLDDEPTMRESRPWHEVAVETSLEVRSLAILPAKPPRRRMPESVESLSLPEGHREEMLAIGVTPDGPVQARIWLVRVARDLARDYRRWYGVELRDDANAIERMQRHLSTVVLPQRDPKAVAREVVRHGLLLGEILVRLLGASWVDLRGVRPGAWELSVPCAERLNPMVQVQRFLQQGTSGRDLVALFLELDAEQRRAG